MPLPYCDWTSTTINQVLNQLNSISTKLDQVQVNQVNHHSNILKAINKASYMGVINQLRMTAFLIDDKNKATLTITSEVP